MRESEPLSVLSRKRLSRWFASVLGADGVPTAVYLVGPGKHTELLTPANVDTLQPDYGVLLTTPFEVKKVGETLERLCSGDLSGADWHFQVSNLVCWLELHDHVSMFWE